MDEPSLADIAQVVALDFARGHESLADPFLLRELTNAVEIALLTAVRGERRACSKECARRADLWGQTAERSETPEHARTEARQRANEARYLSDALAVR